MLIWLTIAEELNSDGLNASGIYLIMLQVTCTVFGQ